MDQITALAIIALAALLQSSFQLSVSMVTLLSGHSIGSKHSGRRTSNLIVSFWLGVVVMTTLVVSFLALLLLHQIIYLHCNVFQILYV